jgi:hypothetical protein
MLNDAELLSQMHKQRVQAFRLRLQARSRIVARMLQTYHEVSTGAAFR